MFSTDNTIRYTDVKIGSVATKKVVAPFNFFILKTEAELLTERNHAVDLVPYYFEYDIDITAEVFNNLNTTLGMFKKGLPLAQPDSLPNTLLAVVAQKVSILQDSFKVMLSSPQFMALNSISKDNNSQKNLELILNLTRKIISDGILDVDPNTLKRSNIAFTKNDIEENIHKMEKKYLLLHFQCDQFQLIDCQVH